MDFHFRARYVYESTCLSIKTRYSIFSYIVYSLHSVNSIFAENCMRKIFAGSDTEFSPLFESYHGERNFIYNGKRYDFVKNIGKGCSGCVALFRSGKNFIAVKCENSVNGEYVQTSAYVFEASVWKQFYGTGVFSGDVNNTKNPHYILIPYFKGKTFFQLSNTLPWFDVVVIWIGVARAIEKLHALDIIHGDIKSDNIIVEENSHAKLIDFGFSMKAGDTRILRFTKQEKKECTQYPLEFFCHTRITAEKNQDWYELGRLFDLFVPIEKNDGSVPICFFPEHVLEGMRQVRGRLSDAVPEKRCTITQSIFMIASLLFLSIPKNFFSTFIFSEEIVSIKSAWMILSCLCIEARVESLQSEIKCTKKQKQINLKIQKINGLRMLSEKIIKEDSASFGDIVSDVLCYFPKLKNGFFRTKTKDLIEEIGFAQRIVVDF